MPNYSNPEELEEEGSEVEGHPRLCSEFKVSLTLSSLISKKKDRDMAQNMDGISEQACHA